MTTCVAEASEHGVPHEQPVYRTRRSGETHGMPDKPTGEIPVEECDLRPLPGYHQLGSGYELLDNPRTPHHKSTT